MRKNLIAKSSLFIFSFIILFAAECVMNGIIYQRFFVTYPLLELAGILGILAPIFIFKKQRNANIYSSVVVVAMLFMVLLNLLLDFASGDIFSLKYIFLAGEAAKVFNLQFIHFGYVAIHLAFMAIYFSGMVLINKLELKNHSYDYSYHQLGYSIFFILIIAQAFIKMPSLNSIENDSVNKVIYKDKSAYEIINFSTNYLKKSSLKNYGLITYNMAELDNLVEFNSSAIESKLDDFYASASKAKETEFTGLLEGMNVVTIMVETGVAHEDANNILQESKSAFINEIMTPNLYKLYNDGVAFMNNHSKNKTNMSELIGVMGSIGENLNKNGYNAPYSLPNVLGNEGYKTTYLHDNKSSFYSRNKVIPSLGFENYYFLEDINPEDAFSFNGNYPLDSKFMEKTVEYMIPSGNDPFYSFWTTLSTHGPYNVGMENINYFREMGYYDTILEAEESGSWVNPGAYIEDMDDRIEIEAQLRNYQAEMMDLDRAIGLIVDRLNELGKMDDTLIVIYGDHEMYYSSNGYLPLKNYIYDNQNTAYSPQYETMMLFHNEKLSKKFKELYGSLIVKEFTSPYMIVPTTLELLGIEYNTNSYFGKSFFQIESELENLFYSHELKVLFNDNAYAYSLPELEWVSENAIGNDEYLRAFINQAILTLNRITMFNDMYRLEYFNKKML